MSEEKRLFNKVNLILCSWVEPLGANALLKRMCFCFGNDSSDPPLRPGLRTDRRNERISEDLFRLADLQ